MATRMLRRGLPRVPGGEPWPPAAAVPPPADVGSGAGVADLDADAADAPGAAATAEVPVTGGAPQDFADTSRQQPQQSAQQMPTTGAEPERDVAVASAAADSESPAQGRRGAAVRRGLPRVPGGEPWPPAAAVPSVPGAAVPGSDASSSVTGVAASAAAVGTDFSDTSRHLPLQSMQQMPITDAEPERDRAGAASVTGTSVVAKPAADTSALLPWRRTVSDGRAPRHVAASPASARRRLTWPQVIVALMGAAAMGIVAGAATAFVRALLSLPFMQEFLTAFPGQYEPAIAVEPGFAPWIGWQHFFNAFLMVLIIRSGLRVRTEKRPTVFWTPRGNYKGKISLSLWFHQALDILWLVNGVIFVVLIFATGHWVRIVPTSWEVFPNALSATLQYVSFDWPHNESGWNNYNSLQQLAYFTTVFLAAPLAAVTGFRMSGMWPKRAERLSRTYPAEWARAVHFPVMIYFVVFIVSHVMLVTLTGFLRNLNHMYAAQDAVTWTGFWVFIASLVVIVVGWTAARLLALAPIAKLLGTVSGR